jgi:hypothetical protein
MNFNIIPWLDQDGFSNKFPFNKKRLPSGLLRSLKAGAIKNKWIMKSSRTLARSAKHPIVYRQALS